MYQSVMWKYMAEERALLSALMECAEIREKAGKFSDMTALYITAHGSSYNAAVSTAPLISELCRVPVSVWTPSGFLHNAVFLNGEDRKHVRVLGISQTGTSRGVIEAMKYAKELGFSCAAITNEKDSPVDLLAEPTFYLHCGEEKSNAKTKGFSLTLLSLLMLGVELGVQKETVSQVEAEEIREEIRCQIDALPQLFADVKAWCEKRQYGKDMDHLYVIGNGMLYGLALEGMLKVMETMCIPTMVSDVEEFSHGMHRSVKPDSHVMLLRNEVDREQTDRTHAYLKEKGVDVLVVNASEAVADADTVNVVPCTRTSSILSVAAVIQAIAAFVPEQNGLDPNRCANNDYTERMGTRIS